MTLQNRLLSSCGRCLCLGPLFLVIAASACADVTYYTEESAYQAAVNNLTLESFETPTAPVATATFGDVIVTETSPLAAMWTTSAPTKVTNGEYALELFTDGPSALTFSFAEPMSAFGIHIISFGTTGPGTLSVSDNSGITSPQTLATSSPLLPPLNDVFFGINSTDTPFTQITFSLTTTTDAVSFDGLRTCPQAVAVPEPLSGILAIGLLLFLFRVRSRKKH